MSEVENLATLFVRLGGGYFLVHGLLQLSWSVVWLFSENERRSVPGLTDTLSGAGIYFLLAFVLFYFSRRLGRLLAKNLD